MGRYSICTHNLLAANHGEHPWSTRMTAKGQFVSAATDRAAESRGRRRLIGPCGVLRAAGEYRLVAIRPIRAGERLFRIEGDRTPWPSRYSVQIGEELHVDLGPGYEIEAMLDRYFWRFMNHGCDPNLLITGEDVVALCDIEPGVALTFNYNTTEWNMAEPFRCHCGSSQCLGTIRGFKHLTAAQRERLHPHAAPHLLRLAAMELQSGPDSLRVG
jgi:hypothetical protein